MHKHTHLPVLGSFILVGFRLFSTHTASMTKRTGRGGAFIPLTSLISFLVSVLRACTENKYSEISCN